MLRALLLSLALAVAATPALFTIAAAHERTAPSSGSTLPWTQAQFDDSELPAATGWFLVPVSVDQPAHVRFSSDVFAGVSGTTPSSWAILLVLETAPGIPPVLGTGQADARPVAAASHDGKVVTCCAEMWSSYSYSWGDGPEAVIPMEPGQVAWFGLAAVGWGEWDDARFEAAGQALITLGEPRVGERVESVDLYREAVKSGTSLQAFGADLVALPGSVERTWTSDGYGVLLADAWSWGARATFAIALPGEEPRIVALAPDAGAYATAHRAGTYRVSLSDIERPPTDLASYDGLSARVFFADIDVPGDTAFVYAWPEG